MTQHSGPGVTGPIGVVAHYNLLESLEPSGPGEMFRARDTKAGRTVTLRWLPADFTPDAAARAELIAEAKSMTSLSHPNVITLFDAGEHDGRVFLAFEFLQGQSLRKEMAGQHRNLRRAVETSVQIADAIAAAHATGLVRRPESRVGVGHRPRPRQGIPLTTAELLHRVHQSGCATTTRPRRCKASARTTDPTSTRWGRSSKLQRHKDVADPLARRPPEQLPHVSKELGRLTLRAVAHTDLRPQSMAGEPVILPAMDPGASGTTSAAR